MVFDAIKPSNIIKRIAEARAARKQASEDKSETSATPRRIRFGGWPTTPGYDHPSDRWPY